MRPLTVHKALEVLWKDTGPPVPHGARRPVVPGRCPRETCLVSTDLSTVTDLFDLHIVLYAFIEATAVICLICM